MEGARLGSGRIPRGPGYRGGHRALRRSVPAPFGGELRLGTGDELRPEHGPGGICQRRDVLLRLETAAKRYAGSLSEFDPSLEKFLPFTLAGGDRRWIVVRTSLGNCGRFAAGTSETYTRFKVTYSVLGFTKHAWVPLPKDIGVDSPPDFTCPSRVA